jgi:Dihydro-orotase-like
MRYKISQTILLITISIVTHAQTLQSWTWDTYKIKFKAPNNLDVQKNDATVYEATNKTMALDIYPRKGENLTYDGMKNAIVKWATDLDLSYNTQNSDGDTQPIYIENINGYWGCAIDGSKKGFPSTIMLLVNPDYPELSFYIWLSYAKEYYHDAVAILRSFTPM